MPKRRPGRPHIRSRDSLRSRFLGRDRQNQRQQGDKEEDSIKNSAFLFHARKAAKVFHSIL